MKNGFPERETFLWAEPAQWHLGLSLVGNIVMDLRFVEVGFDIPFLGYLLVRFPDPIGTFMSFKESDIY